MTDKDEAVMWCGQMIDDMTREEAIEALKQCASALRYEQRLGMEELRSLLGEEKENKADLAFLAGTQWPDAVIAKIRSKPR
jgi:hypothetical protein